MGAIILDEAWFPFLAGSDVSHVLRRAVKHSGASPALGAISRASDILRHDSFLGGEIIQREPREKGRAAGQLVVA